MLPVEIAPESDSPAELCELGEADIAEISGGSVFHDFLTFFNSTLSQAQEHLRAAARNA